jgi:hypothetical protein
MKHNPLWILTLAWSLPLPLAAQTAPADKSAAIAQQLEDARKELAAQAALLKQMREELNQQSKAIEQLRGAQPGRSVSADDAAKLQAAAAALRATVEAAKVQVAAAKPAAKPAEPGPADLFLRIGNAKITPGGWIDLTAIYRSTNLGSGLTTSFASIPYNNTVAGGLSEVRFTSQATRLNLRFDETFKQVNLFGFVEADFNGYMAGNGYVSSNSSSLRLRVAYANINYKKWDFLGGEMWSLLTPTRKTLSPYTGDLYTTLQPDNGYQVGFTYARQSLARAVYHPTPNIALALGVENPEQFTSSQPTLPALFSSSETDMNAADTTGGLLKTPNPVPDITAKLTATHTVAGHPWHAGVSGLLTTVRIVTPVSVTKTVTAKDTRVGGAIAANTQLELFKGFRFINTGYWSDGGARYMGGIGPGFVVLQPGKATSPFSIAKIHSGSAISSVEWDVTKKLTVAALASGAYFQRRYGLDPSVTKTTYVGYGFPGSANSNNRVIQEITFDTVTSIWKNPLYGGLQLTTQSSYVQRAPWYVAPAAPKNAHEFVQFVNVRYILP